MAHSSISNWTTTDWTDDMVALARDKYVPMIMAVGAQSVQMIRTGDLSFSVVTTYPDAAACAAAQSKIAELRAQAKTDMPMTMDSVTDGEVIAQG